MSGYTTGVRNAYRRGKDHYKAGGAWIDNPYKRADFRKSWADGFRDAGGGKDAPMPKALDGDPRDFPPPY